MLKILSIAVQKFLGLGNDGPVTDTEVAFECMRFYCTCDAVNGKSVSNQSHLVTPRCRISPQMTFKGMIQSVPLLHILLFNEHFIFTKCRRLKHTKLRMYKYTLHTVYTQVL